MRYLRLSQTDTLPERAFGQPYKTILLVDNDFELDRQFAISEWLVESGCLYVMVTGRSTANWAAMVDLANLARFDFEPIPDAAVVIATTHENESLQDVFWFSNYSAMHPCCELNDLLLLDLSDQDREQALRTICAAT